MKSLPIVSQQEVLLDIHKSTLLKQGVLSKEKLIEQLRLSVPGRVHLESLGFKLTRTEDKGYVISSKPHNYDELTVAQLEVPHAASEDFELFAEQKGIKFIPALHQPIPALKLRDEAA